MRHVVGFAVVPTVTFLDMDAAEQLAEAGGALRRTAAWRRDYEAALVRVATGQGLSPDEAFSLDGDEHLRGLMARELARRSPTQAMEAAGVDDMTVDVPASNCPSGGGASGRDQARLPACEGLAAVRELGCRSAPASLWSVPPALHGRTGVRAGG